MAQLEGHAVQADVMVVLVFGLRGRRLGNGRDGTFWHSGAIDGRVEDGHACGDGLMRFAGRG